MPTSSSTLQRRSGRAFNQQRQVRIQRRYTKHAEGSVLIESGDTQVICTATVEAKVPNFLRGQALKQGWITAEYGMLPRSTGRRLAREASRGKQGGRTLEIQRLIGRSLRAVVDLEKLGEHTITLDCDVIQADGGTRTASITGAYVALCDAIAYLMDKGKLKENPIHSQLASISVGIVDGQPLLDLDYHEDSRAETDLNVVMNDKNAFIEVQGTAENISFSRNQLNQMLDLAEVGIATLLNAQRDVLDETVKESSV